MNKNAREKQLLEEAYSQVLGEQSESKAPKGDSFDSEKNYKPSGVDAGSDGPGGRYRRIRINKPGRSKETHGGRGVQDEEHPEEDELEALIAAEDNERYDGTDEGECESCGGLGCEDCNGTGLESTRQFILNREDD